MKFARFLALLAGSGINADLTPCATVSNSKNNNVIHRKRAIFRRKRHRRLCCRHLLRRGSRQHAPLRQVQTVQQQHQAPGSLPNLQFGDLQPKPFRAASRQFHQLRSQPSRHLARKAGARQDFFVQVQLR